MRRKVGRADGRTAGRIDPDFAAVDAELFLPHGHAALHFLDDVAAGLERLGPMRGRRDDRDTRLPDGDRAQSVSYGDTRLRPPPPPAVQEPAEIGLPHPFGP